MGELSKGSSQKVAVAQALLAGPELLVLDEAWTGLDADARDELERVVVERTAAGAAAVFVDHDPRRLAGAPDATYAVVGGSLDLLGGKGTSPAEVGDRRPAVSVSVVVEGRGPSGAQVPDGVRKLVTAVEETASGAHRFTVPQAGSDALLRALLEARPPWHVVSVGPARAPADSPEPEAPAEPAPAPAPAQKRRKEVEMAPEMAPEMEVESS